jgi:hypothetical protein
MTDLTGWVPHDGLRQPPVDGEIMVLLRGGAAGPKESGPSPADAFEWGWAAADTVADITPAALFSGKEPPQVPSGDIIAWCAVERIAGAARYPHVRADLGR